MRFYGISKEDLDTLQSSLRIFDAVYKEEDSFLPYIYLLVKQGEVFQLVEDQIHSKPSSVAVALPLSSDVVHFLMGSGILLDPDNLGCEYAYKTAQDEGARVLPIAESKAKVYLNQVSNMAVSSDSSWIGEFLDSQAPMSNPEVVEKLQEEPKSSPEDIIERTKPATTSSSKTSSGVPGVDRILIAGKPLINLSVTETIEIGDFIVDHPQGVYLHFGQDQCEWLMYTLTEEVELAERSMKRILKSKLGLKTEPEIIHLTGAEVEELLETYVDEL